MSEVKTPADSQDALGCVSCVKRLGPALWQAALVHLEVLEAMLPKEPTKSLPDPCHDRHLQRHWRKLQKNNKIFKDARPLGKRRLAWWQ